MALKSMWYRLMGMGLLAATLAFTAPETQAQPLRVDGGLLAAVAADATSGVRSFKGIPYAAAPVGDLRWRAPGPVAAWSGERRADTWGARCMQNSRLGAMDPLNPRMDEDCLYLNVWTPARSPDDKLPVMVWIHGGSNTNGAASQPEYQGEYLARQGVVLVSINYRLDVFGFLAHPDLTAESGTKASGNYALLDQIAALRWVQNNVAAFGGDPARVTVFGESAGAFDVSLLMASPLAKGLFAGAIGQSGGSFNRLPGFGPKPLRNGEQEGQRFVEGLGAKTLAELRAVPAQAVLDAATKAPIVYGLGVIDGYVVPDHPATLFAQGRFNDVPLLVGFNADEGSMFAPRMGMPADPRAHEERIRALFKEQADAVLKLYPAGASPQEAQAAYTALIGDQLLAYGSWAWAELAARNGKSAVYRYYFNRRPPGAPERQLFPLSAPGVFHFSEINYVFNNFALRPEWAWTDADRDLGARMAGYWTRFARTGNPNGVGAPEWPAYRANGGGKVLELGVPSVVREEPRRDRMELADSISRALATPR